MNDGQTPIRDEKRHLCEYCEKREAVEWSDQGKAQCEECRPGGSVSGSVSGP